MINWTQFENRLLQYVKSQQAKNEDDFAQRLVEEYDTAIKTGTNQYFERPLQVNKNAFASALKSGFKVARLTKDPTEARGAIKTMFSIGVISYWIGGTLALTPFPPGSISIVTNIVTFPGNPPVLLVGNTNNVELMVRLMSAQLKTHSITVAGITTALVNVGGTPIPTPFLWTGIK